jgi:hypothetical protein
LINLAFINLPSNCLVQMNESPKGVLHKPKKNYPAGFDAPGNKFDSITAYA